jgi:hypothetical protein
MSKEVMGFNIQGYATDPTHYERIKEMTAFIIAHVEKGGSADSAEDCERLTAYMRLRAAQTPLTGEMLLSARDCFNLGDPGLFVMMALIQNDTMYGTRGEGARLHNPGNVGDDDAGHTVDYGSWQTGVDAVAQWLDKHRCESKTIT